MTELALFEHGYALVIGVDEHQEPSLALPAVAKDITALTQVLTAPERCAYPTEQVKVLRGREATQANILQGIAWLGEQVKEDPAGHRGDLLLRSWPPHQNRRFI